MITQYQGLSLSIKNYYSVPGIEIPKSGFHDADKYVLLDKYDLETDISMCPAESIFSCFHDERISFK